MIKTFEEHIIINSGDLGDNWSAEYHIKKSKGLKPYIKKDGFFVEIHPSKAAYLQAEWFLPDTVKEYNKIATKIKELQKIQNDILEKNN